MRQKLIFLCAAILIVTACKKKSSDSGNNNGGNVPTIENIAWDVIKKQNLPITKVEVTLYTEITSSNKVSLVNELKNASVILNYSPNINKLMTFKVLASHQQGWINCSQALDQISNFVDAGKSVYTVKWSDNNSLLFQSLAVTDQAGTLLFDSMLTYPILNLEVSANY